MDDFEKFYSFSLKRKTADSAITKTVFNNVVKNKGLLLKSSTAMRTAILNSNDTALISKYNKWMVLKKEISDLYAKEISKRAMDPETLEQQADVIEKEIVRLSQVFSDFEKLQKLNWESVKNSLKPGEAAIEFLHFNCDSVIARSEVTKQSTSGNEIARNDDIVTYCALVITPQCRQPEMIRLFYETNLESILGTDNKNNLSYINGIYGANQNANEQLYKLIWLPLEKYLEGAKTVYYSPDGLLHKISFSAIAKDKNILLCDEFKLQQMSSTGKLAMAESPLLKEDFNVALLGGIQYSTDTTKVKVWTDLPGTKTETDEIAQILKAKKITTSYFSGNAATEESFKNLFCSSQIAGNESDALSLSKCEKVRQGESEKVPTGDGRKKIANNEQGITNVEVTANNTCPERSVALSLPKCRREQQTTNNKQETSNPKPETVNRKPSVAAGLPKAMPEIIHIATHGFFYPDPDKKLKAIKDTAKRKEVENLLAARSAAGAYGFWNFYMNKNPLMRSGLVLAHANNVWDQRFPAGGDDGVLTAQEVSQLDLRTTKLVVMSACETGLGDIRGSEGVYGLQRAFKMAGVSYIIMSLWQVADKETEEFMTTFYEKLLVEKDIRKAFGATQSEMRKKYDPFFWAAFVLIE